jgi:Domain of unknown function (DUF3859)
VRIIVSIFLLALFSAGAAAQGVQSIEVSDVGIYKAEMTGGAVTAPGTPMGKTNLVNGVELMERTTIVPAALGTSFGFRYKIVGETDGADVNLKFVNHYPEPGLKSPTTGNTYMSGEYVLQRKSGLQHWKGYTFESDWELVPGAWTFEIWVGDRKMATQDFTVVK